MKKTKERKEKMLKQKGITLIALVITIIVMLILVAVTVSYTIKSGLLGKAQNAKIGAEIEQERETLTAAVAAAYDVPTGTIEKDALEKELGNGWSIEGDSAPYTVTSPKGNKFTVEANGKITLVTDNDKPSIDAEPHDFIAAAVIPVGVNEQGDTLCSITYFADKKMPEFEGLPLENAIGITYGGRIEDANVSEITDVSFFNGDDYFRNETGFEICFSDSDYVIRSSILGIPVTGVMWEDCTLTSMPTIPESVVSLYSAFHRVIFDVPSTSILEIPKSVKNVDCMFANTSGEQGHNNSRFKIEYKGTVDEYKQIEGYNNIGSPGAIIYCTDGTYTTEG